jgi:MFS family permease
LTYGLTAPLIAIDLAGRGFTEFLIGLNAAMHAVGVLSVATLLPSLAVRYGPRPLIVGALGLSAVVLAAFPYMPSIWLWFPLRVLLGVAAETLFVLTETWTNDLSDDRSRGRTMAIYTSGLSLGFAGGPAILSVVGSDQSAYLLGGAIAAAAAIPLANPWMQRPAAMQPAASGLWRFSRLAPIAIAAELLNAAVETAGLSFIALYATGVGWTEAEATRLVSTLLLGAIVLQLPIGWLADRINSRRLVLGLAVLSVAGALAWPWMLDRHWLAHAIVFVWGGLFVGIYTVMLMIVGSRFHGSDLVGIYAIMSVAWGVGALVGPALAGFAMGLNRQLGLPYAIAFGCAAFTVFMLFKRSEA